jgi:hypothetical protein
VSGGLYVDIGVVREGVRREHISLLTPSLTAPMSTYSPPDSLPYNTDVNI